MYMSMSLCVYVTVLKLQLFIRSCLTKGHRKQFDHDSNVLFLCKAIVGHYIGEPIGIQQAMALAPDYKKCFYKAWYERDREVRLLYVRQPGDCQRARLKNQDCP